MLENTFSYNEVLPIKMAIKSFKENDTFSSVTVVGSVLKLSAKRLHIEQVPLKILVSFDQADTFAYSCSFTLHPLYKMTFLVKGGKAVKMLKLYYYRSPLDVNFVQACS